MVSPNLANTSLATHKNAYLEVKLTAFDPLIFTLLKITNEQIQLPAEAACLEGYDDRQQ
jgi:hypothetical protein